MRLFSISLLVMFFVSCGTGEGGTKAKKSRLLGRLKNTQWAIPYYPEGNLSIGADGTATVSMNSNSFISNGTVAVLEEDPKGEFVVFNIYNDSQNYVLGLSVADPETIHVSVQASSNSLEGYKDYHDKIFTQMKKQ